MDADTFERIYVENCRKSNSEIQPRLVFVGVPLELAYVLIAHVKYRFEDIKKAIETYMVIFLGLNVKYPEESKRVWYFLQKYIFKITTSYDKPDIVLNTLAHDLKLI